jgi:signal peptidase I
MRNMFGDKHSREVSTGVRASPVETEQNTDTETTEADTTAKTPKADVAKKGSKKGQIKMILAFFVKLGVFCLALWAIFTWIFGVYQMYGEYMYPGLRDGDLIFYYRLTDDYNVDDVVTFRKDGDRYVARIVAVGGDVVDISSEGELMVNGHIQDEDALFSTVENPDGISFPYTVEEDSYFLLYDYRLYYGDSRDYGGVSGEDLDGKVFTILRRRGI